MSAVSEGLTVPESRAMGASAATMAKRSGHAESRGLEGRGERPATGMGSPSRKVAQQGAQVKNLCYKRRGARWLGPVSFHVPARIGYPVNR